MYTDFNLGAAKGVLGEVGLMISSLSFEQQRIIVARLDYAKELIDNGEKSYLEWVNELKATENKE